MELRPDIEPDLKTAASRYPEILKLILDYTAHVDLAGDENLIAYQKLESSLQQLTQKDISQFNMEWWEEEGAEVLAFRIALPDPVKLNDLTPEELEEITFRIENPVIINKDWEEQTFEEQFSLYLDDYYRQFLKLNSQ
ncbi:hypothetical protein EGI16_10280 [Chryseobacterium sp. G0240]|uniref:hypothetical protein n=1 Tax=Chryseobacterium sp. G0240 TaxID=2487066 RepID=UPI000F44CDD3|nr:hypothetical protein [Chryseobacterium sp. G0240]ROI03831.1 hypothetical protein EGI16_10280 [Chryseobacterium sp. G0240]